MDSSLQPLEARFGRARDRGEAVVLATVFETAGSTYRKAGAHLLIDASGDYVGLVSGGCLEGDLALRAKDVIDSGAAQLVSYDMRGPDDQLWGLGAGCEGAMQLLLQRVSAAEQWQPLAWIMERWLRAEGGTYGLVVDSAADSPPRGALLAWTASGDVATASAAPALAQRLRSDVSARALGAATPLLRTASGARIFVGEVPRPRRLLLLGAGPDARPVCELAGFLGWHVTAWDHRSAYADPRHFPRARVVRHAPADELSRALVLDDYSAAVVMSHHLESDGRYLQQLAECRIPYVGLLGPAHRREKLLGDLGRRADLLRPRLRAPIGLDLGGRAPEAIALAIVAEIQSVFESRSARPFSESLAGG